MLGYAYNKKCTGRRECGRPLNTKIYQEITDECHENVYVYKVSGSRQTDG